MTITESESGLGPAAYTALQTAVDDPSVQVTLRQYTPAFSSHDSSGDASVHDRFDVVVCNDVVVRAYRPAAANTITIDTLADEAGGDQAWSSQNLVATNINNVALSLAVTTPGGDTVRVFWYDNTNLKYHESVDKGANWGAAQTIGAVSSVLYLAATSTARLHYVTRTTKSNYRFHVYIDDGGWAVTSSEVYWPHMPTSLDAVEGNQQWDDGAAAGINDIIAFTTDFPPIIGLKVQGTEVYNTLTEVQGIACMRYQNGRWSDHWAFDVVDKAPAFPSRYGIRLTTSIEWIFMCYERYDGTENYGHYATAISRSKTGLEWELPYLLTRDMDDPTGLAVNGNYTYLINSQYTYRSLTCGYTGTPQITQTIEDNVVHLSVQMGDIAQLTLRTANPEQELDATTPFSNDAVLDAVVELGYMVGGVDTKIQTMIADIDTIDGEVALPTDHITITGRDHMARLLSVQADQPNEWESQAIGGDNFQTGDDATDYSGLRHTAVQQGFFTAPSGTNSLALAASESPGIAFSTLARDAWNGSIQSGIYVESDEHDDWAGLVFRAYDKKNFMSVRYAIATDSISLVDTRDNTGESKHTESPLGWVKQTWYYLKVRFRYNYVWVYTSADGVDWSELFTKELNGAPTAVVTWTWDSWTDGDVPGISGRMGYAGYGYSDYDEDDGYNYDDWPPLPDPVPIVPFPTEYSGRRIIATDVGVFYTDDISAASPTWVACNDGLGVDVQDLRVVDIKRDPFHWWNSAGLERTLWAFTGDGIFKLTNFPDDTWTQIVTMTTLTSEPAYPTSWITYGRMDMSIEVDGRYALAYKYGRGGVPNNVRYRMGIFDNAVQSGIWRSYDGATGDTDGWSDIAFGQHSGGQLAIGTRGLTDGGPAGIGNVMRTPDGGASWIHEITTTWQTYMTIVCPYVNVGNNDQYWFVGSTGTTPVYESVDRGLNWAAPSWSAANTGVGTGIDHLHLVMRAAADVIKYSSDGGLNWTLLPAHGVGQTNCTFGEWDGDNLSTMAVGRMEGGVGAKIEVWAAGDVAWTDKTGNLVSDFSVVNVYQIDRDTMDGGA